MSSNIAQWPDSAVDRLAKDLGIEDVIEAAAHENLILTEKQAQDFLVKNEDALYEAAYYAALDRMRELFGGFSV